MDRAARCGGRIDGSLQRQRNGPGEGRALYGPQDISRAGARPVFEAETGIKTEVVQLGSGDVTRRARAEAKAPKADVIWSITGSLLTENADLLEPYKPKEAASIDPRFVKSPAWTPYTAVIYVLMQNTRMVPDADMPKTLADLADPKWKGKIASARADNSGSAFQQIMTVLTVSGDHGWKKYGDIAANFVLTDSSGAVPRYVADGEAPARPYP